MSKGQNEVGELRQDFGNEMKTHSKSEIAKWRNVVDIESSKAVCIVCAMGIGDRVMGESFNMSTTMEMIELPGSVDPQMSPSWINQ